MPIEGGAQEGYVSDAEQAQAAQYRRRKEVERLPGAFNVGPVRDNRQRGLISEPVKAEFQTMPCFEAGDSWWIPYSAQWQGNPAAGYDDTIKGLPYIVIYRQIPNPRTGRGQSQDRGAGAPGTPPAAPAATIDQANTDYRRGYDDARAGRPESVGGLDSTQAWFYRKGYAEGKAGTAPKDYAAYDASVRIQVTAPNPAVTVGKYASQAPSSQVVPPPPVSQGVPWTQRPTWGLRQDIGYELYASVAGFGVPVNIAEAAEAIVPGAVQYALLGGAPGDEARGFRLSGRGAVWQAGQQIAPTPAAAGLPAFIGGRVWSFGGSRVQLLDAGKALRLLRQGVRR